MTRETTAETFETEKTWFFFTMDTSPMLEIRHAHHDMLRKCRCKRMERTYLRFKKKAVSEQ